ncbi:IS66 family insertion sequence hypothetical protein, partial [Salmonella enterica subsp. enterica]|nr:IS66 family insertion sequence hypothetical protein [Salmonella enterica subsp. enterica serovar Isaszeg]
SWLTSGIDWQQVKGHDLTKWVFRDTSESAAKTAIT